MPIKIGPNWISAALTLASGGVAMNWPGAGTLLMIAGALVLLAGVRIDGWHIRISSAKQWSWGAVAILVAMPALLIIIFYFTTPPGSAVYAPFLTAYHRHSQALGEPTSPAYKVDYARMAWMEHGNAI
jgi:hypothetical protein